MTEHITTKVLVVGGGPGGYVAAIRAGQLGLDTTLVEAERLGGTCLIRGCIPSKAMIHVAGEFETMHRANKKSRHGISLSAPPALEMAELVSWKEGIVTKLSNGVGALCKRAKVRVLKGWARFSDAKTCTVELGLLLLPTNFSYLTFAGLLVLNGIGSGLFSSPNTTAIMNSVPAHQRGQASGMRATFFNSGSALSIGVFFSLMIAGLAATLPAALQSGLTTHHVPAAAANAVAAQPPVGSLFAAFLGYNPIENLVGVQTLSTLPSADRQALTGSTFFPNLISGPFHHGLIIVFGLAIAMSVVSALASLLRGNRYVHDDDAQPTG